MNSRLKEIQQEERTEVKKRRKKYLKEIEQEEQAEVKRRVGKLNKRFASVPSLVNADLLQLQKATGMCIVCEKRFKLLYNKNERKVNYAYKLRGLVTECETCIHKR